MSEANKGNEYELKGIAKQLIDAHNALNDDTVHKAFMERKINAVYDTVERKFSKLGHNHDNVYQPKGDYATPGLIYVISINNGGNVLTLTAPTNTRWAQCSGTYTGTGDNCFTVHIDGHCVYRSSIDFAYRSPGNHTLLPVNPGQVVTVRQDGGGSLSTVITFWH